MQITLIKVTELKPAEYNPREIDPVQLEALKKSITKFGLVEPIVVNKDMTVIGGHQRLKACIELGHEEVPCNLVDVDKETEKKMNLALNKIVGSWNEEKLVSLIKSLEADPDINLTGFSELEIEQLLMQHKLSFTDDELSYEDEEELEKLFDRNEKLEIPVEKPDVKVKENKLAFYVRTMDEYKLIKEKFKTTRGAELDIDKLLSL